MWSNKRNRTVQITPIMCCTTIIKGIVDVIVTLNHCPTQATTNAILIVETKQLIDVHNLLNLILRSDFPPQELLILEKVKFVTEKI